MCIEKRTSLGRVHHAYNGKAEMGVVVVPPLVYDPDQFGGVFH